MVNRLYGRKFQNPRVPGDVVVDGAGDAELGVCAADEEFYDPTDLVFYLN